VAETGTAYAVGATERGTCNVDPNSPHPSTLFRRLAMKHLMIEDLSLTEELHRAPMGAVRGGFCGTPAPGPVITLPPFPEMPALPAMPGLPVLPSPGLPGHPVPYYQAL